MQPQTQAMDGMQQGEAFYKSSTQRAGFALKAVELGHDKAVIQVDIENGGGAPTCLDGRPMLVPGPSTCEQQPERDTSVNRPVATGDGRYLRW